MFSKYNPLKDVEIFTNQFLNLQEKKCLLIGGVGTGLHIKKLEAEKNISIIFALENDKESIEFSKKHFQNIIKKHPTSDYAIAAEYYLGLIEVENLPQDEKK